MAIKIEAFSGSLKNALKKSIDALTSNKILNDIGKLAVKLVRTRTKLGKGVTRNGAASKSFKKYSNSYVKQRKLLKKQGKLAGTPNRVSLTQTGEMLDKSLDHTIGNNKVTIEMSDGDNEKKAEFVSKDRPFMNLSKAEIKQIEKVLRDAASKIFKKELF